MDYSDTKVILKTQQMRVASTSIVVNHERNRKQDVDIEELASIKIDMNRSYVFGDQDVTGGELRYDQLPEDFRDLGHKVFKEMDDVFSFPVAGSEEHMYSNAISTSKPSPGNVFRLHELTYTIPVVVKTTFKGYINVGGRRIDMCDVIKLMREQLLVERAAQAQEAAENPTDQFTADGKLCSFGQCTLMLRRRVDAN